MGGLFKIRRATYIAGIAPGPGLAWKSYRFASPVVTFSSFWAPLEFDLGSFWGTLGIPGRSLDVSGPDLGLNSDFYRFVYRFWAPIEGNF